MSAYKLIFVIFFTIGAYGKTILFLGDSLTEGYGIDKSKSYPQLLINKLRSEGQKELKFINGSVSGSTSASASSRLRWFLKSKPDVLVLALGANDGLRGIDPSSTYKNLEKVIKKAKDQKVKVLLLGLRMPPNYGAKYTSDFENIFKKLANKYDLVFVPYLLKNVAGEKDLNQEDGIHPNEKGHEVMMKNVYPKLKSIL